MNSTKFQLPAEQRSYNRSTRSTANKSIRIILFLVSLFILSSCSTYKYSNPGKARYTTHRSGKWMKQAKKNRSIEAAQQASPGYEDQRATQTNIQSKNTNNWDWLGSFGLLGVMILAFIALLVWGGASAMVTLLVVLLGLGIFYMLLILILAAIVGAFIMGLIGLIFG